MRISKVAMAAAVAGLASSAAFFAVAQQPAPPAPQFASPNLTPAGARALAANCAGCHGTDGKAVEGSTVAALAGMPADWIATSMKQYRDGRAPATVMHQIAKGYTDEEIAAVSEHFSKLAR